MNAYKKIAIGILVVAGVALILANFVCFMSVFESRIPFDFKMWVFMIDIVAIMGIGVVVIFGPITNPGQDEDDKDGFLI